MARPERRGLTQRVQVVETGETPSLNVVAPILSVRARSSAAQAAEALKASLGLASDTVAARYQRDFERGEEDARLGQIDEERRRKHEGYAAAAEQVETEAMVADDETELDELLKEHIANGDVDAVRTTLKDELARRWSGLTDQQRNVVVPWAAGYEAKVVAEAEEQAQRIVAERNFDNIRKAAEQEYRNARLEGRTYDFARIHAAARELFGKDTNAVLTDVFAQVMDNNNAPKLLDELPDEWAPGVPSIKHTPGYRERLLKAAGDAQRRLDQERATQLSLVEYEARKRHDKMLRDGDPLTPQLIREIDTLVHEGIYTPALAANTIDAFRVRDQQLAEKAAKEAQARSLVGSLDEAFRTGRWHPYLLVESQDGINDAFDAYVAKATQLDPVAGLDFVAHASMLNGLVYRPLQAQLNRGNLENPDQFQANADAFRTLYAQSPALARQYVTSDSMFDLYAASMTMQDYGRDPVQVLSEARKADFSARQSAWMEGDLRKEALARISNIEIDTLDSFFDQEVGDLRNKGWVIGEYRRLIDTLGQTGSWSSAEELLEAADRIFEGRYMVMGNVALPRTADVPADAPDAWEWFHDEWLQKELDAAGVSLNAADVELRPDTRSSRDRATFALFYRDSYEPVLPDLRFTLDAIARQYRAARVEEMNARRPAEARRQADRDLGAKHRALVNEMHRRN